MAYCVSNMIGIRAGGVFSGEIDIDDIKKRIQKVILKTRDEGNPINIGQENGDPSYCMSQELSGAKGSYVVLAGAFNYLTFDRIAPFAAKLSKEFMTEVMLMSWDEEVNHVQCQMFLGGQALFEEKEDPVGKILRRIL